MQMMMLYMYLFLTFITLYNEYLLENEKQKRLCIPSRRMCQLRIKTPLLADEDEFISIKWIRPHLQLLSFE